MMEQWSRSKLQSLTREECKNLSAETINSFRESIGYVTSNCWNYIQDFVISNIDVELFSHINYNGFKKWRYIPEIALEKINWDLVDEGTLYENRHDFIVYPEVLLKNLQYRLQVFAADKGFLENIVISKKCSIITDLNLMKELLSFFDLECIEKIPFIAYANCDIDKVIKVWSGKFPNEANEISQKCKLFFIKAKKSSNQPLLTRYCPKKEFESSSSKDCTIDDDENELLMSGPVSLSFPNLSSHECFNNLEMKEAKEELLSGGIQFRKIRKSQSSMLPINPELLKYKITRKCFTPRQ